MFELTKIKLNFQKLIREIL